MTTVLLVRHAEADDRELARAAGIEDHLRALTPRGRKRMARIAPALSALVPDLAFVASSPLLRAVQTAAILAEAYRRLEVHEAEELAPGTRPDHVLALLAKVGSRATVALVGHEPDLGLFASWALGGSERSFVPFKKGGAALLRFSDVPAAGSAELLWLLTPAQLRRLPRP